MLMRTLFLSIGLIATVGTRQSSSNNKRYTLPQVVKLVGTSYACGKAAGMIDVFDRFGGSFYADKIDAVKKIADQAHCQELEGMVRESR